MSEEEDKMMGRFVSLNSELKKRIEFLKSLYVGIYKRLENQPLGHIWIEKLGPAVWASVGRGF
ncbi:hypothetical protein IIC38_11220 [candidate division KSB1 bacterium]|nr:hypothetical protein [candidate division KSB1 bacterium]